MFEGNLTQSVETHGEAGELFIRKELTNSVIEICLRKWKTRSAECGVRSVENAECRKCGVWKMRSVENAECRKCGVWKMRSVENAECGKCGV